MFEALEEAVRRAGSQSAFGEICGISQPSVWKMLQSSKRLTAEYVLSVERATGVSRHYLRPDIYPPTDWSRVPPMVRAQDVMRAPRRARSTKKSIAA